MKNIFILFLLFLSCTIFADTIYINLNTTPDSLKEDAEVYLLREIINAGHEIINDRANADWVFEIELVQTGDEIIFSYMVLIDSRSRNVFYEEFLTHTWVSFYKDNFSRFAKHHIDHFKWVLDNV